MLGVAAANVLPSANILRSLEFLEEVIVRQPQEWTITVNRGFANDTRFVDVEILESVVGNPIDSLVAVVMATGASASTLVNFIGEEEFATCDFSRIIS